MNTETQLGINCKFMSKKKNSLIIVIVLVFIIGFLFIYIYPFAKGVKEDAVNNKHETLKDSTSQGTFTIKKDSLNN